MSDTESEHSPDDSDDQEYEGLEDVLAYAKEPECTEAEPEARSRRFEVNEDEAAAAAAYWFGLRLVGLATWTGASALSVPAARRAKAAFVARRFRPSE